MRQEATVAELMLGIGLAARAASLVLALAPTEKKNHALRAAAAALRAQGMPVVGWTVRSSAQWESVREHCDNLIFEGFAA